MSTPSQQPSRSGRATIQSLAAPVEIRTARLRLEPLAQAHAEELAPLLDDRRLHAFIGGAPQTLEELRERYRRQAVGRSPDGSQLWLNWVARLAGGAAPVGTFQATVGERRGELAAQLAWVVVHSMQRRGYAREGAVAVASWLREQGVGVLLADIHPAHAASIGVARAVGLAPSAEVLDGEVRWIGR